MSAEKLKISNKILVIAPSRKLAEVEPVKKSL